MAQNPRIAVVIPCYKVRAHILGVLDAIGAETSYIYAVDDCCPEHSGDFIQKNCKDPRVRVLRNSVNLGVGGAVLSGYRAAIEDNSDIIVKVDGDGQMDPRLIPYFAQPIMDGEADYTKGNRFYDLEQLRSMPAIRLFGNAVLSFMSKASTGYWNIFDPTNGYTAVHADIARRLPFEKISKRYFFETDILFRLNILRAVVVDLPMDARYAGEVSNLMVRKIIFEFAFKHLKNALKRIFYNYYLRDFSLASIELPLGILLLVFGSVFGAYHWILSTTTGVTASAGTVLLAVLPILMGVQFILAFLSQDVSSAPVRPIGHNFRSELSVRRKNIYEAAD